MTRVVIAAPQVGSVARRHGRHAACLLLMSAAVCIYE